MFFIKCPTCGCTCSSVLKSCSECHTPLQAAAHPMTYEHKTVKIRCWGWKEKTLEKKLIPYLDDGWEIITADPSYRESNFLSPLYKVLMRRPKP